MYYYIFLLKITLSLKVILPTTNPTAAIIGILITIPAIPAAIPIKADRPKDSRIMTKAYQLG